MCVLEPVIVLPNNFPRLSLCKWKPTNQNHCQPPAHLFDSFPKKPSGIQLSSYPHSVITSLGPTEVFVSHHPPQAEAYVSGRAHLYLPGKGLVGWNYINTISGFFITIFLESVKNGIIILKLHEIVVTLEYYSVCSLGIFIIPIATEVVSQPWKRLLGKPKPFSGALFFLQETEIQNCVFCFLFPLRSFL